MIIVPNAAKLAWTSDGIRWLLDNSLTKVHLFQADLTLDADTTLAELQADEADFPGYVAPRVFTTAAGVIVGDVARLTFDAASYVMNDVSPTNIIYGYWVFSGFAGPGFAWCEKFDTPIDMDFDGAELVFVPRLDIGQIV